MQMLKLTKNKLFQLALLLIFFVAFFSLSGCGGSKGEATTTTTNTGTATTVASLTLSASPPTVKSDDSNSTTITIIALTTTNAAVANLAITVGTDTGLLVGAPVTDDSGKATVTFSAGSGGSNNAVNRTATITATAGTASGQIPVQIVGSTITLASTGTTLPDTGIPPATVTVTAYDAGGNTVAGAAVALTHAGTGNVTITPATGTTDSSGKFTATVAGQAAGAVTLTAAALGTTKTIALTVSASTDAFIIDQQTLCHPGPVCAVIPNTSNSAIAIGDTLAIQVHVPSSITSVTFATTVGSWSGGTNTITITPVVANEATATLTTTVAGVASVMVYNTANPATNATLTVAMTSGASAHSITLQATPNVVPISLGTTTGSATLIATVVDLGGVPVGNAPVLFSILDPTGGGETISPVVVLTAATPSGGLALGQASSSFTSGSLASPASGVPIRASVVGTTVATGTSPSGNDQAVVIGGQAGSIAFGQATVLSEAGNGANYVLAMSVLVSDISGAPVINKTVTLSAWPIAWSTGVDFACAHDADDGANKGTFLNEDINENVILDPGEDGKRTYYAPPHTVVVGGTSDGQLTPPNSSVAVVPGTVTTNSSGLGTFNLIYPKQSAIWTLVRIRATTVVQGSETRGEIIFRLAALLTDVSAGNCKLQCPYVF